MQLLHMALIRSRDCMPTTIAADSRSSARESEPMGCVDEFEIMETEKAE